MKNVIKLESLAIACYCLQNAIDQGMTKMHELDKGVETVMSLMADFNSLMSAVKEIDEAHCNKFIIIPLSDAQAEEYTDSDSIGKN